MKHQFDKDLQSENYLVYAEDVEPSLDQIANVAVTDWVEDSDHWEVLELEMAWPQASIEVIQLVYLVRIPLEVAKTS